MDVIELFKIKTNVKVLSPHRRILEFSYGNSFHRSLVISLSCMRWSNSFYRCTVHTGAIVMLSLVMIKHIEADVLTHRKKKQIQFGLRARHSRNNFRKNRIRCGERKRWSHRDDMEWTATGPFVIFSVVDTLNIYNGISCTSNGSRPKIKMKFVWPTNGDDTALSGQFNDTLRARYMLYG